MPRQEILPDCVSLKSCWSPAAPAVYTLFHSPSSMFILVVSQGAKAFTLEPTELEMHGWGRLGKATGAKLQAPVTLIRSAQLLSVLFA